MTWGAEATDRLILTRSVKIAFRMGRGCTFKKWILRCSSTERPAERGPAHPFGCVTYEPWALLGGCTPETRMGLRGHRSLHLRDISSSGSSHGASVPSQNSPIRQQWRGIGEPTRMCKFVTLGLVLWVYAGPSGAVWKFYPAGFFTHSSPSQKG